MCQEILRTDFFYCVGSLVISISEILTWISFVIWGVNIWVHSMIVHMVTLSTTAAVAYFLEMFFVNA